MLRKPARLLGASGIGIVGLIASNIVPTAACAQDTVKIGIVMPLTGAQGAAGQCPQLLWGLHVSR